MASFYDFRGARAILEAKKQLIDLDRAAELTNLSSSKDHKLIQSFLRDLGWEAEKTLFPIKGYKLDLYKEKTGVEIERSLIDAVHRSLFRCLWSHRNGSLDVLVFIIPHKNNEISFNNIRRDLEEFREIIPYPVFLIGIENEFQAG